MSLRQNLAVKFVAVYAALGFVLMEILYLGVWCRPFTEYWAVPPDNGWTHIAPFYFICANIPSVQCSAATNHLITNAVLNISSDIMIILIPMPIFLKAQLPPKKKAILFGVFAIGGFTVGPIPLPQKRQILTNRRRIRSCRRYSTNTTPLAIPLASTGSSGTSANLPPLSSRQIWHIPGHYYADSLT